MCSFMNLLSVYADLGSGFEPYLRIRIYADKQFTDLLHNHFFQSAQYNLKSQYSICLKFFATNSDLSKCFSRRKPLQTHTDPD
jgi:hypothetical protein